MQSPGGAWGYVGEQVVQARRIQGLDKELEDLMIQMKYLEGTLAEYMVFFQKSGTELEEYQLKDIFCNRCEEDGTKVQDTPCWKGLSTSVEKEVYQKCFGSTSERAWKSWKELYRPFKMSSLESQRMILDHSRFDVERRCPNWATQRVGNLNNGIDHLSRSVNYFLWAGMEVESH